MQCFAEYLISYLSFGTVSLIRCSHAYTTKCQKVYVWRKITASSSCVTAKQEHKISNLLYKIVELELIFVTNT